MIGFMHTFSPALASQQSDFRKEDSTEFHLMNLLRQLCSLKDCGHNIGMCFFDLAKAFDTVWHRGLLLKLSAYAVTGKLVIWATHYLSERTQSVKF